jgi:PrtD family type I secretion system ABC transporter
MSWLFAKRLRSFVLLAGGASLLLNVVLLVPALYMMQVFDRVFTSHSVETLVMLSAFVLLALVLGYFVDTVRARALAFAGRSLDRRLSAVALSNSLQQAAGAGGRGDTDALRDISQLRTFLSGSGILALFDAPWLPIYLLVIGLMHPVLGIAATIGAGLLIALAVLNERLTRHHAEVALRASRSATRHAEALSRNAEAIVGMGMTRNAVAGWQQRHDAALEAQSAHSHAASGISAVARFLRQFLQVALLGLGAWLVIDMQASAGIMVAATILLGRALQPVEHLIAGWKYLLESRSAWRRLQERAAERSATQVELPAPTGRVDVERLVFSIAANRPALIKGIALSLAPGESLGVIGPSASGKTTLIRLMLGIWKPQAGVVRLDGADIARWDRDSLGQHVGYLPQDVELFSGTVAQNIARLGEVDSERVVAAAQLAHAHEMILRLPEGYETQIGDAGAVLSGGQRQRLALARAL